MALKVTDISHHIGIRFIDTLPGKRPGLSKAYPPKKFRVLPVLVRYLARDEHRQNACSQACDVVGVQQRRLLAKRAPYSGMKDAAKGLLVAALDELHSEFHTGRVTSSDPGDDESTIG